MEKSLGQQMEVANYFCFISFGINQINDGIIILILNLFTSSNYLYSLFVIFFHILVLFPNE